MHIQRTDQTMLIVHDQQAIDFKGFHFFDRRYGEFILADGFGFFCHQVADLCVI